METEKGAHGSTLGPVPIQVQWKTEGAQINSTAGCPYYIGDQCRKSLLLEIKYFCLWDKIILQSR